MNVRVKICGITNLEDALAAVEAGADALGFMFYEPSPRYLKPEAAAKIIEELPPFVSKVGVFVNAPEGMVRELQAMCGLELLQFHGEEEPEYCRRFGGRAIKAFRVRDERSIEQMAAYRCEAWLLDTYVAGQPGGTGTAFNWGLAELAARRNRRVILAGGLTPENVAKAVAQVRPCAVDVSSGVELSPGRKCQELMRRFISAAKGHAGVGEKS